MTNVIASGSLQFELQSLLAPVAGDQQLRCHGTSKGGAKCKIRLGKRTKKRLQKLISSILRMVEAGESVEEEVEELSSLILCIKWHQGQANSKYKLWMERIKISKLQISQEGKVTKVSVSKTPFTRF